MCLGHELVLILKQYLFNSNDLSYADNAFITENYSTGDLHNLKLTNIIFIILMHIKQKPNNTMTIHI